MQYFLFLRFYALLVFAVEVEGAFMMAIQPTIFPLQPSVLSILSEYHSVEKKIYLE